MSYSKKPIKKEISTEAFETVNATQTEKPEVEMAERITEIKKQRKYEPDDLIPCRSMYAGTLLFTGEKTKLTYEFSNMGDFRYIEYQDLLSAMLLRKKSIFAPYIIIEDEELLDTIHWRDVKAAYDGLYDESDLVAIINLPTSQFSSEFRKLPVGFKNTIATMVSEMIREGTFDSMNKIKIIDEVCGTDLKLLSE